MKYVSSSTLVLIVRYLSVAALGAYGSYKHAAFRPLLVRECGSSLNVSIRLNQSAPSVSRC